jgi:hypothetical protein
VPVLCVESETDLMNLGYLEARQDDGDGFVLWEIAGASHGDMYTFVAGAVDDGRLPVDELARLWVPVRDLRHGARSTGERRPPALRDERGRLAARPLGPRRLSARPPAPRLEVGDGASSPTGTAT